MTALAHLAPAAAEKLALAPTDRITHLLRPRWIEYPQASRLLARLEDLLAYPRQARMPNMLIIGDTNNGKTMLVNAFRDRHPADPNLDGDAVKIPVLYIQAPPGPDERGLYNAVLTRLFEPHLRSESTDQKRDRVVALLKRVDLGMIIIDEIHHLIAGPYLRQRNCLNVLKYLGNELCVPLVGVGTAEAMMAVNIDPQLANRFIPEVLPKWTLNADYAGLLTGFERAMPLHKPSHLASRPMATKLLAMTGGCIGELSTLLNEAAKVAIQTRTECITLEMLDRCHYTPPAERKQAAARL